MEESGANQRRPGTAAVPTTRAPTKPRATPLPPDEVARRLLRDRVCIIAWIVLVVQVIFATADIRLNAELFIPLLLLKLLPATTAVLVLVVMRRTNTRRVSIGAALAICFAASTSSAVSGMIT